MTMSPWDTPSGQQRRYEEEMYLRQLQMQQMPPPEAMRQQAQFHQAHIRPTDAVPPPNPVLLLLTTP